MGRPDLPDYKMTFIETTHAANRLKTRGISSPNGQRLVSVGRGTRRRIRQTCPDMGCDLDEYTYFRNKQKHIFVTKQISKDVYLLITAFKI